MLFLKSFPCFRIVVWYVVDVMRSIRKGTTSFSQEFNTMAIKSIKLIRIIFFMASLYQVKGLVIVLINIECF